jgi:hypothetical protein
LFSPTGLWFRIDKNGKIYLIFAKLSQDVFRHGHIFVLQTIVRPLKDYGSGFIRIANFYLIFGKLSQVVFRYGVTRQSSLIPDNAYNLEEFTNKKRSGVIGMWVRESVLYEQIIMVAGVA